jgi:hypothetical protein
MGERAYRWRALIWPLFQGEDLTLPPTPRCRIPPTSLSLINPHSLSPSPLTGGRRGRTQGRYRYLSHGAPSSPVGFLLRSCSESRLDPVGSPVTVRLWIRSAERNGMDGFHLWSALDNFYIEGWIHGQNMIAYDMYCCISLVELDAPVLNLPKFRPSSEVPTDCIFRLPGKECVHRLLFLPVSYSSADGATDRCTSVVPVEEGVNSSTKNDSSGHKSIDGHHLYLVQFVQCLV